MPSGHHILWDRYDSLFHEFLPSMTISEFTRTHLPGISCEAAGARARKLGIKPARYHPTTEHKTKIAKTIAKATPELVAKIRRLRDSMSIRSLARECSIGIATLARINRQHGIGLSPTGLARATTASRRASLGKTPWNKGKKLPEAMKVKMAEGRQRMSGRLSELQITFYRILDELQIGYYREEHECCRFGPWTFDCRIKHGKHDILVEVQGGYIHSLPKNIAKDRAKATYMERYYPEVPIRYVWEHEFGAANRVKQQVQRWLGLATPETRPFDFADVTIREIEEAEAGEFLAAFHYLGKLAGRTRLGAFLENTLLAVSVWSAPTRHETAARLGVAPQQCSELRRFVIHDHYHKPNFGSWLLARMERLLPDNIRVLVSFSDPGIGHDGGLYRAANWQPDGETEPSYFYVDEDGYVILKKTLFCLANKLHMREADYAETYRYTKVWTPPKLRFRKNRT